MVRILTALCIAVFATAALATAQPAAPTAPHLGPMFPDKPTLLRGIEINEAALEKAWSTHASNEILVKIYSNLGGLYEDASLYLKSEDAMRHAISLLRTGPQDQLADEFGHLGMLHVAMDEQGEAVKDQLAALRIRESIGDPIGIALSRNDLADVYIKERRYNKALDLAQASYDVLAENSRVAPTDRIGSYETLAYALCGIHQCDRAIALLQSAIQLASASFGADSLSVGLVTYLLGDSYWKNGDLNRAADLMRRGTDRMKQDMGWGHAMYLNAMAQYAKLLRQRGEVEAASAAQREVRQAADVVDARSFTGR